MDSVALNQHFPNVLPRNSVEEKLIPYRAKSERSLDSCDGLRTCNLLMEPAYSHLPNVDVWGA